MIGQRTFWLGTLGSLAFLVVFVVLFVDFDTIGDVLKDANYAYVGPSLIFYFLAVQARSMRWKFLLRPLMGKPRKSVYPVVVVGYMANNLIPVRIGEVLRSYYLSLREEVSTAGAFGTVAVERASDGVALLFFLGIAAALLPVSGAIEDVADKVPGGAPVLAVGALLPFLAVLIVVVVLIAVSLETSMKIVERLVAPLPKGLRISVLGQAEKLLQGLTVVRSPRHLVILFLLSVPVWALEALMYWTISLGFDLNDTFSNSEYIGLILVFTAAANLAGVFPSSAGGWGPFDFFGAAALVAVGVGDSLAAGFALTVHVALWLPVTVLGLILLLRDGTSLKKLMSNVRGPDSTQLTYRADVNADVPYGGSDT